MQLETVLRVYLHIKCLNFLLDCSLFKLHLSLFLQLLLPPFTSSFHFLSVTLVSLFSSPFHFSWLTTILSSHTQLLSSSLLLIFNSFSSL
jgi:hypothetical protein